MEFGIGSVPVVTVAEIYGKDANWVRAGIVFETKATSGLGG